ncbi:unnamed protein product [Dracunculus medinensis]|uniref:PIG-P domain-containing protein n=1 Tax=Dracunculus medinensis TaxID=318479 RepID=A0A0N4UQP6_DRAME|nr:unnamed protein product [Dracunculus medinensis]
MIVDDRVDEFELLPCATPNPHPARAIYGFVFSFAFFLTSSIFLFIYLIWAIIPTPWLESIEITYVPAKYWAISIPLLFPIIVTAYVTTVFALNLIRFHGVFENIASLSHRSICIQLRKTFIKEDQNANNIPKLGNNK